MYVPLLSLKVVWHTSDMVIFDGKLGGQAGKIVKMLSNIVDKEKSSKSGSC